MVHLLDGKKIAENVYAEIRKRLTKLSVMPGLAIMLVGDNPASALYVRLKKKAAKKIGIDFHEYIISKDAPKEHILETIQWLNKDKHIHGIVLQLPLPERLNENELVAAIDPKKDADGFHPENLALLVSGTPYIKPAVTNAVIAFLKETKKELFGKKALIVSNAEIFAKPLIYGLRELGIKGSYSAPDVSNIQKDVSSYDIIIVAVGRPHYLSDKDFKKGAIVVDIGINKVNEKTVGDIDPSVYTKGLQVEWISPVPGGVGPLTIAMLLKNVVTLAEKQLYAKADHMSRL